MGDVVEVEGVVPTTLPYLHYFLEVVISFVRGELSVYSRCCFTMIPGSDVRR